MNDEFPGSPAMPSALDSIPRPLLTVERAAFLASVSEATIRRAIRDHRLPVVSIGRSIRIRPEAFEAFISGQNVTGG